MDSTLILEHAERLAATQLGLSPTSLEDHARAQRIIGLALAACEKTVQIVYEHNLRPTEKQHQPWLDRVHGQLSTAYALLEAEVHNAQPWLFGSRPLQADIASAVAYHFTTKKLPGTIDPVKHPALASLSAHAEATEAFKTYPHG